MKINRAGTKQVPLEMVPVGGVFSVSGGSDSIYMLLDPAERDNAVNISVGTLHSINLEALVIPYPNAELKLVP